MKSKKKQQQLRSANLRRKSLVQCVAWIVTAAPDLSTHTDLVGAVRPALCSMKSCHLSSLACVYLVYVVEMVCDGMWTKASRSVFFSYKNKQHQNLIFFQKIGMNFST